MTILQVGVLALAAAGVGQLKRGRSLALLGASVFAIYWLQSPQQFVSLAFWLPTATLALTVSIWILVTPAEERTWRGNLSSALVISGVILLVDLNQFIGFEEVFMTTTPRLWMIGLALIFCAGLFAILIVYSKFRSLFLGTALLGILLIFVYLKSPELITNSFDLVYRLRGQAIPDTHYVLSWLGYSYMAFRLLHTIRDHQTGRLPSLSLGEYVNYVIFFPSFTAGPIDRAERFVQDLRSPSPVGDQEWIQAGKRFFLGLFKKYVIADTLALISINDILVEQVHSAGWMWFFLYMYSLRIYFDFSGYTDVAIGIARVMGVRLPENFAAPYMKPNLAQFWNSWHMTLTHWFRTYFFNPTTRALRSGKRHLPAVLVILVTQVSTMVLIGLWHGIAWGFVVWGLWHGVGLFIQNRWSELLRRRTMSPISPQRKLVLDAIGVFLTFNFVSLGWLFFTLSTPATAWRALLRLFGVAS